MTFGSAVIGANYGDEGKGLTTDWLCRRLQRNNESPIVVRFNGGAQAGHTVVRADGARHVFGHLGSGTLAGAPTHFSHHTMVNPMRFVRELIRYNSLRDTYSGIPVPRVSVDPRALVTTPIDMVLNRIAERSRGNARHGSCGTGINETFVRNEAGYRLTANDLFETDDFSDYITNLILYYAPGRLRTLGVERISPETEELYNTDWNMAFQDAVREFRCHVQLIDDRRILDLGRPVFEGAQGLGLHESRGHFPYVTRSRTGLENVIELCEEAGLEELTVYYATRVYNTRHGAGPMDLDDDARAVNVCEIKDPTNLTNEWQGAIRTQALSVDDTCRRILEDWHSADDGEVQLHMKLMITHCDTLPTERWLRFFHGETNMVTAGELTFVDALCKELYTQRGDVYRSYGPTAGDIRL